MAHSSPEGIILGKGSTLQSLDLSINKEKVLSIKQQDKKLYSEEDLKHAFFSGCQSERRFKPRVKCWEEFIEQFKRK